MATAPLPEWNGDETALRHAQRELAMRVSLKDGFPRTLRTIAGLVAAVGPDEGVVLAAAVLMDAGTLAVIESRTVRMPARMPFVAGLRSFRDVPALLEALSLLSVRPDLAFVEGQGVAHPRRIGLASHFGVAADLPTIGVSTRIAAGEGSTKLHDMRGAFTTLRDRGVQIGWLLRSKVGHDPLVVSPGHRVAMATAPEMTMRFVTVHRVPEPLRLADPIGPRDE